MQDEEDRELQEAMEATGLSIFPEDYIDPYQYQSRRRLMSLGNVSAPPMLHRNGRFSSIGKTFLAKNHESVLRFMSFVVVMFSRWLQ